MSVIYINSYQFASAAALWTPAQLTTALWLDAADASTITLNGSTVSEWRDKSGNSRHASQVTSANQPTYADAGFNAKPTIQFDGVNDQLDLVQFAQASNQNIFAVVDTTNLGAGYGVLMQRTSAATSNLAIYFAGFTPSGTAYTPMVYWNGGARASWGATVQAKAIIRWSFATGAPASALTQVNGQTAVTETFTASNLTSWSSINLSSIGQSDVDISELVITPATPSTLDRQKLEGYLAHKWGLTANLPADHPYKSAAPTV